MWEFHSLNSQRSSAEQEMHSGVNTGQQSHTKTRQKEGNFLPGTASWLGILEFCAVWILTGSSHTGARQNKAALLSAAPECTAWLQ